MFISEDSLDDLLHTAFDRVLKKGTRIDPTRGGARELFGVLLELKHPRSRLSRTETKGKIFSCIGEFLWYMSGSNDLAFIEYYLPRYKEEAGRTSSIYGGYGPRLFNMAGRYNQIDNIIRLLRSNPDSRRAVIQIFDAKDIHHRRREIPCTCTIQFLNRYGRLHAITSMRSNDVFRGLQHDIFAFTMLQEYMANALSLRLGSYKHSVGSLHLYDTDIQQAASYLSEGWQIDGQMPAMPTGDQMPNIQKVLSADRDIRIGKAPELVGLPYWDDIVRLLQIFASYKSKNKAEILATKKRVHDPVYLSYIERSQRVAGASQGDLLT